MGILLKIDTSAFILNVYLYALPTASDMSDFCQIIPQKIKKKEKHGMQ